MKRLFVVVPLLVLSALVSYPALAQNSPANEANQKEATAPIEITPSEVNWGPPPVGLTRGTPAVVNPVPLRFAVLEGDPLKPGAPFTIELGCADGNKVAPHWHPTDENIVVLRGTFAIATGDVFDPSATHDLAAGSYAFMPEGMHHFAFCKGDTVLLIFGIGPFHINWIEPPKPAPSSTLPSSSQP